MRIGIIGGGPAGYVAAIRAAQLGAEVTVFEKENLGGVCTNWGCIPTKALYSAAKKVIHFRWGVEKKLWSGQISPDWRMIQNFKNGVVTRLVRGIEFLFKKNRINLVRGEAGFLSPNEIEVETAKGRQVFEFDAVLIATGSRAAIPPVEGLEGIAPWDNVGALSAEKIPQSLVIIGGGVIGVEFAHIFATFGSEVTIVELMPKILPFQDNEVSAAVHRALTGEGVKILTRARAVSAHRTEDSVRIELENGEVVEAEQVVVAVGRRINLPPGIETTGVKVEKNHIPVDERRRTNVPTIYAAGDVTGEPHLEHKASHEGIVAVENMMGLDSVWRDDAIPAAIFSALEVGACGLTEKQAREKFGDGIKVGKFPYIASGRAQAEGENVGFVKIIADPEGTVVGFHAVGADASELVGLGGFLVQNKIPLAEVSHTIFSHPTLSEMIGEAALAALGRAIHI